MDSGDVFEKRPSREDVSSLAGWSFGPGAALSQPIGLALTKYSVGIKTAYTA